MSVVLSVAITTTAYAAVETRTYRIDFNNSPDAGPAVNARFVFPLPDGITPVDLPDGATFQDGQLSISGPEIIEPGTSYVIVLNLQGPSEILDQLESQDLIYDWEDDLYVGKGRATQPQTEPLQETTIIEAIKNTGPSLAVGLGGVGIIALGLNAAATSASFAYNMAGFFRYLAFGFFRFKKRKPWGTVYNNHTNAPVPGALVRLYDSQYQKLKETQVTDKQGRFGFLVTPGSYYIKVKRNGFLEAKTETINITNANQGITMNIDLSSGEKEAGRFWRKIAAFLAAISIYILVLGNLISLAMVFLAPSLFNYIILTAYIALDIIEIIFASRTGKPYGTTYIKETHASLDLVVVRIFDTNKSWLLKTKVSNTKGKFSFLVTKGKYYLSATKNGYKQLLSQSFEVSKADVVNLDLNLEKEY